MREVATAGRAGEQDSVLVWVGRVVFFQELYHSGVAHAQDAGRVAQGQVLGADEGDRGLLFGLLVGTARPEGAGRHDEVEDVRWEPVLVPQPEGGGLGALSEVSGDGGPDVVLRLLQVDAHRLDARRVGQRGQPHAIDRPVDHPLDRAHLTSIARTTFRLWIDCFPALYIVMSMTEQGDMAGLAPVGGPAEMTDNEGARRRRDQDELIIGALAEGMDYAAAGRAAGTSARTVRRRMESADFAAEVSRRRGERVSRLAAQFLDLSELAVGVIQSCLGSDTPTVQLKAADLALQWGNRLRSSVDHEQRLTALEQARAVRTEKLELEEDGATEDRG